MSCRVQLLDGSELNLDLDKKASGQDLFDAVCNKLSLNEVDYFGCTFKDGKNGKVWVNSTKKLNKQNNGPWIFSFEVKFYPPDPTCLRDEITRYQLFLQLRTDILAGKLPGSFVTNALLGSYAAQSQLGDHCPSDHGTGHTYLRDIHFVPHQTTELLDKIADLHKTHQGMQPAEAELMYLENASKVALYGVHQFLAKDSNDSDVQIGVCAIGLLIYRERLRVHRFTWPKILKISYKRNIFTIKIRPGEFEQMESVLDYKLPNYLLSKRLWKIGVEHHSFFRLRETDPPPHGLFSRFGPKYRYTGKTFYQAQQQAHGDDHPAHTIPRVIGRKFAGSKSMETVITGYSTERSEAYQLDSSRCNTLDMKDRRQGSMEGLDHRMPASPGVYSNTATRTVQYKKLNDSARDDSYPGGTGGSDWGSTGQLLSGTGTLGKDNNASYSATSDEATFPLEPVSPQQQHYNNKSPYNNNPNYYGNNNYNNTAPYNNGNHNNNNNGAYRDNRDGQYDVRYERQDGGQGRDGWVPYNENDKKGAANTMQYNNANANNNAFNAANVLSSSSKTYTMPDGTVVTEHRIERDGVIETRVEKKFPDGGISDCVDYDQALSDAILSVTNINTDLSVEKIEIQTEEDATFV